MIGERVLLNYTYKYGRNTGVEVGDTCYTNKLKNEKKNNELSDL